METYPHSAKTFLREAKESLDRLREAKDADDINRALITFLNATKHTIHQLQTGFKGTLPNFNEWYIPHQEFLQKHELSKFFWDLRNRVTKKGENIIKIKNLEMQVLPGGPGFFIKGPAQIGPNMGISVKVKKGGGYEWQPVKNIPGLKLKTSWEFLDYPNKDPINLCESYLNLLDGVVDSFVEKFTIQ